MAMTVIKSLEETVWIWLGGGGTIVKTGVERLFDQLGWSSEQAQALNDVFIIFIFVVSLKIVKNYLLTS